jgi:hypothetical protein
MAVDRAPFVCSSMPFLAYCGRESFVSHSISHVLEMCGAVCRCALDWVMGGNVIQGLTGCEG